MKKVPKTPVAEPRHDDKYSLAEPPVIGDLDQVRAAAKGRLAAELGIIRPKVLLCLGATAAATLLDPKCAC